jgi:nucleoside-diphosphate kinase
VRNNGTQDIEIVDPKHKRRQLSRIPYPHLKAEDIRPGGKLVIFGKQYVVLDYADSVTRDSLGKAQQRSVIFSGVMVKRRVTRQVP